MLKNKKLIIILIIAAIIIIGGLTFWLVKKGFNKNGAVNQANTNSSAPQFLNDTEKLKLGLAPEQRIQSLKRGANGEVTVYKVIKSDADVVLDPASIGSLSPRQKSAAPTAPILPTK